MDGIITIKESRDNVNNLVDWRKKEALKIVKSLNTENTIDNIVDGVKTVVSVAGVVLNVVTKVIPGKLDDIAVMVAQPAIVNAVEASRNFLKGIFVNKDKQEIQASLADLGGQVKNITIRDTNLVEIVKDKGIAKVGQIIDNRFNKNHNERKVV